MLPWRTSPHIGTLICLLVVLACFTYPVTTVTLLNLGLPTESSHQLVKALTATLYLYLLVAAAFNGFAIPFRLLPLLGFFALYSIRLIVDLDIKLIAMEGYSAAYVHVYFFALTALPVLALVASYRHLDLRRLHHWMLIALVAANLALIVNTLTGDVLSLLTLLAGRAQVEGLEEGTAVLSPLTYGLMGASLASFALGRLCLMPSSGARSSAMLLVCVFLGLANMMLGASRGPFVGFALSTLLIVALTFAAKRPRIAPSRWRTMFFLGLPIGGLAALASLADVVPSFLFERLLAFLEERSSGIMEERDYSFHGAIQDFLRSPVLGHNFVGTYDNFYPHNIVLETLMATGLVGTVLLSCALIALLLSMWRIVQTQRAGHGLPILLVGICMLFSGMTSGSIHSAPEFWIFLALLTCMGLRCQSAPQRAALNSAHSKST